MRLKMANRELWYTLNVNAWTIVAKMLTIMMI